MKVYLTLWLIFSSIALSNELEKREKVVGCSIPAFTEKKSNCLSKEVKKHDQKNDIKSPKNSDLRTPKEQLSLMVYRYQSKHTKKEKHTKERLMNIKKEFLKKQKKHRVKKKPLEKVKKTVKNKKKYKRISLKKSTQKRRKIIKKSIKREKLPSVEHLPWVDIITDDHIDIYQLAQLYYGNKERYLLIYAANRNIIGANYKIKDGMHLKIPMTTDFKEQPMFLNTD